VTPSRSSARSAWPCVSRAACSGCQSSIWATS
jgi:hypothetical protein